MIDRSALEAALGAAEAPELLALAGELQGRAWARLAPAPAIVTEILEPGEAARLVGVHKRWLLDATRGMAFRRDLGHRTKRFDKAGLLTWAKTAIG